MFAPPIARVFPEALSVFQAGADFAVSQQLIPHVLRLTETLAANCSVGSHELDQAVATLHSEYNATQTYADASLLQLGKALGDSKIANLLERNPEIIERGLREISESEQRDIAISLDRILYPKASKSPELLLYKPLLDAKQVAVTIGTKDMPGEILTAYGSLDATWAEMIGDPEVLFHRARDAGRVMKVDGQWCRRPEEASQKPVPITLKEVEREWGEELSKVGIRDLPSDCVKFLKQNFGGQVPDYMFDGLMKAAGLDSSGLKDKDSPYGALGLLMREPNVAGQFYLYCQLGAMLALGKSSDEGRSVLQEHFRAREIGLAYGACFDAAEKVVQMQDKLRAGTPVKIMKDQALTWSLHGVPPAVAANFVAPPGDYSDKTMDVFDEIVGRDLDPEEGARTFGAHIAVTGACATGHMVLHHARKAFRGDHGEWVARLMLAGASDSALLPRLAPHISHFFGEAAYARENVPDGWNVRQTSRPYMRDSGGVVIGEGGAALPGVTTLYDAALEGLPYLSKILGTAAVFGQGMKRHENGVNEGIINAIFSVLRSAWHSHGVSVDAFKTVLAHGTSTGPSNIEEPKALWFVLNQLGYSDQIDLYASKGLLGHAMGVSSFIDLVISLKIMLTGILPGLHNFDPAGIDPRITDPSHKENGLADFTSLINFSNQVRKYRGGPILSISEGFGSANSAVAMAPEDFKSDLVRYSGIPLKVRADYPYKMADHMAKVAELAADYRAGKLNQRQIAAMLRYRRRTAQIAVPA